MVRTLVLLLFAQLCFSQTHVTPMAFVPPQTSGPAYQALRPSGDVLTDGCSRTPASGTFFSKINEVVLDDATYIEVTGAGSTYICNLDAGSTPGAGSTYVLHVKVLAITAEATVTATLIDASNGALSGWSLSVGQNDIDVSPDVINITDWTQLQLAFDDDTGGLQISQAWLEVPNP